MLQSTKLVDWHRIPAGIFWSHAGTPFIKSHIALEDSHLLLGPQVWDSQMEISMLLDLMSHMEFYMSPNRVFSLLILTILHFACWTLVQAMSQHWMHVEILKRVVNPGVFSLLMILSTSAAKIHPSRSLHVSESALISCHKLIVLLFWHEKSNYDNLMK